MSQFFDVICASLQGFIPLSLVHLWTPYFSFLHLLLKEKLSALYFHHAQLPDLRDYLLSDPRYAILLVTISEDNLFQPKRVYEKFSSLT